MPIFSPQHWLTLCMSTFEIKIKTWASCVPISLGGLMSECIFVRFILQISHFFSLSHTSGRHCATSNSPPNGPISGWCPLLVAYEISSWKSKKIYVSVYLCALSSRCLVSFSLFNTYNRPGWNKLWPFPSSWLHKELFPVKFPQFSTNFLNFPLKFSIFSHSKWQGRTINDTVSHLPTSLST